MSAHQEVDHIDKHICTSGNAILVEANKKKGVIGKGEKTMRTLKISSVLLMALGLIGFMGGSSMLLAGGDPADSPHETHLTHPRGPSLGTNCGRCHNTGFPDCGVVTPDWNNVDMNACNTCHSHGGPFDGVGDPDDCEDPDSDSVAFGALCNWDNRGSSAVADESLIYTDGTVKREKHLWCSACHDGTSVIDGFEAYTDDAGLQSKWVAYKDAYSATLMPYSEFDGQYQEEYGIEGQYMSVKIDPAKNAKDFGRVKRVFAGTPDDPYLDLSDKEAFGFYLKALKKGAITKVKVWLRKHPEGTWCKSTFKVNSANGFCNNVWHLVSLPREAFSLSSSWFEEASKVAPIYFKFYEASTSGAYTFHVYLDEVGSDVAGANVIGDNDEYGYYVTGHRTSCTQCHDPASAHISGNRLPAFKYIKRTDNRTNFPLLVLVLAKSAQDSFVS